MLLRSILSTELRLLEPICTFVQHDGYLVYRSDKFRNFYGGNGIEIQDPAGRSLAEWEAISRVHFDPALFVHTTYTFPDQLEYHYLAAQGREQKYHVETDTYMFVDSTERCRPLPEDLEVRQIVTEEDWQRLAEFEQEGYIGADWHDPNATGPDRLFEKTRFTSEVVGIEWFYLARKGDPAILSKLGLFLHNGIGRLQDVSTAESERRKGYAAMLVSFAIDRAISALGARGVALAADVDYHAVSLYEQLGFRHVGGGTTMMKYPIRNPAMLASA